MNLYEIYILIEHYTVYIDIDMCVYTYVCAWSIAKWNSWGVSSAIIQENLEVYDGDIKP